MGIEDFENNRIAHRSNGINFYRDSYHTDDDKVRKKKNDLKS